MVDARKILAVVAALLVAAWMSPCCCQSAWMAERGAQLVMGGDDDTAGCSCCQKKNEGRTRDCCPPGEDGGTGCTWTGAKVATGPTAAIAVAPVGVWVSIEAGELPMLSLGRCVGGEEAVGRPPGWDGSLLGLGCALLV